MANFPAPLRQDGKRERTDAYEAFCDYLNMGVKRSIRKLHDLYLKRGEGDSDPPTRRYRTLEDWSRRYDWQQRVNEYRQSLAAEQMGLATEHVNTVFIPNVLETYEKLESKLGGIIEQIEKQKVRKMRTIDDPQNPGQRMRVVEMAVNVSDLERAIRAFGRLGKDLRLQLGLPTHVDVTTAGKPLKLYSNIANPDQWDEESEDDSSKDE